MNRVHKSLIGLLLVGVLAGASGCGLRRVSTGEAPPIVTTIPAPTQPAPTQPAPTQPAPAPAQPAPVPGGSLDARIIGSVDGLRAALAQPTPVHYVIRVVEDLGGKSVSDAFEAQLTEIGNPGFDTLMLFIFPKANYDIRFAMGAIFNEQKVTVDEMVNLIRSDYLPAARQQDPALGLAHLIQSLNQRLSK